MVVSALSSNLSVEPLALGQLLADLHAVHGEVVEGLLRVSTAHLWDCWRSDIGGNWDEARLGCIECRVEHHHGGCKVGGGEWGSVAWEWAWHQHEEVALLFFDLQVET